MAISYIGVPGVPVYARHTVSGVTTQGVTDENGQCLFQNLAPGIYEVNIDYPTDYTYAEGDSANRIDDGNAANNVMGFFKYEGVDVPESGHVYADVIIRPVTVQDIMNIQIATDGVYDGNCQIDSITGGNIPAFTYPITTTQEAHFDNLTAGDIILTLSGNYPTDGSHLDIVMTVDNIEVSRNTIDFALNNMLTIPAGVTVDKRVRIYVENVMS
jgi:hypothetical protein